MLPDQKILQHATPVQFSLDGSIQKSYLSKSKDIILKETYYAFLPLSFSVLYVIVHVKDL